MVRDRDIEAAISAIAERGRRTRKRPPRWQWVAAGVVGLICMIGFAAAMLGEPVPGHRRVEPVPVAGAGLGVGLAIGAGAGLVIGFAIGRHRRDHSSRNSP